MHIETPKTSLKMKGNVILKIFHFTLLYYDKELKVKTRLFPCVLTTNIIITTIILGFGLCLEVNPY